MEITVTGKHMDIGESFRAHIHDKINHLTTKYFSTPLSANVVATRDDHQLRIDISAHIGRGVSVRVHADGHSADPYGAFEVALKLLEGRLRRYKNRLRDHHRRSVEGNVTETIGVQYVIAPTADEESSENHGQPAIIAEMPTKLLTLSVSEAIMHLDLSDNPAYIFYNKKHNGLSVVYRRPDGNIGWIDPEIAQSNLQSLQK